MKWLTNILVDEKSQELRRLRDEKISNIKSMMNVLDWNTDSDDGVRLSKENLSSEWTEFVPGMNVKILDIDPCEDVTALLCHVLYPFEMETHWHIEEETTLCLNIPMIDGETGGRTERGYSIRWGANEKHKPKFPEPGFIIVIFDPALPEK